MKVNIGPYPGWFGPYQIAEKLLFWMDNDDRVHSFGTWLAGTREKPTPLARLCGWVHSKKSRTIKVQIDAYDTWSMDSTLALIILPMLQQLKTHKHGGPYVEDEDVPEHLRSTAAPAKENEYDVDDNHFLRWDWVLDEMIQAFSCKVNDDWDAQYHSGIHDTKFVPCNFDSAGKPTLYTMEKGPNDTYKCDYDALKLHTERNTNGYRLFGKYYQGLWD